MRFHARDRRSGALLPLTLALAVGCGAGTGNGDRPEEGRIAAGPPGEQERTAAAPRGDSPPLGTAWVIFGADTVRAEVARTPQERSQGLMYREELPPGTGMLFVFPEEGVRSFWMQNTYVPLDIAFLDASLRVVDIQQMEPESEDLTESRAPAMFALEVPLGWFAERGIRVGDRAEVMFGG